LREIEAYIAKDSPQAAHDMTLRLIRRTLEFARPPLLGKRLARYPNADIREVLERTYRLILRVKPCHTSPYRADSASSSGGRRPHCSRPRMNITCIEKPPA
jgi:hypothetical protein